MSDKNSEIKDVADSVKGVLEAVPVYEDALQPAAKEVGKALETVAKSIHVALAPVSALVWGYDQIKDFVTTSVSKKLSKLPPEQITTPKPNVAGPALEALRYVGHDKTLRELYASLLATSLNSETAIDAHPAFVEIIKQLTSDEAKILKLFIHKDGAPLIDLRKESKADGSGHEIFKNFSLLGQEAGCTFTKLTPSYLDNLCRLGLFIIRVDYSITEPDVYNSLENHKEIVEAKALIDDISELRAKIRRNSIFTTALGRQFISACVIEEKVT